MSRTIHGSCYKALRHMRNPASTLAVLLVYVARANNEGVAWPSVAGLAKDTGWGKTSVSDARKWLADHGALERVDGYIRPTWRSKTPQELTRCQNFDKAEYYRVTGYVEIDGTRYDLLYAPSGEESDLPDEQPEGSDVTPERMSEKNGHQTSTDIRPGGDEFDLKELDLDSTTTTTTSEPQPPTPPAKPVVVVGSEDSQDWLDKTAARNGKQPTAPPNDPDFGALVRAYESDIGMITPTTRDLLIEDFEEYPHEWLHDAIKIAVLQNNRRWAYVRGILKRWAVDGKDAPKPGEKVANPIHLPPGVPGCATCGGTGMYLGPNNESVPCPVCLAAERDAQEVNHERA